MEYDEQLLQVQEKMKLAQNQMQGYKRNLQESTKQLEGGLDEIIKHDGALQQSRLELIYSIDRLEKLRKQRTDELSSLDQNFQKQKQLADAVRQMVQHHDDQLERKKSELQKFSKKAEENERTLERLKNTSQKSEAQLGQLKEAAAPFTQVCFFRLALTVRITIAI
jgi:chromosome segregation ATPase